MSHSRETDWHQRRMCGLDLETTGTDPETARIVTACVLLCGGSRPPHSVTWLSDVGGMQIPPNAVAVHGITTEQARTQGRPAAEVVRQVTDHLAQAAAWGYPLVAMNAAYDLTVIDREARRCGVPTLEDLAGQTVRVLDPMVLDRATDPYRKGRRTLAALCQVYGIEHRQEHTAQGDALAACRLVRRIGALRHPQLAAGLEEIHRRQVKWAAEQAAGLARHYARTPGREHLARGVRPEWPVLPRAAVQGAGA